jgi:hypothetical protein
MIAGEKFPSSRATRLLRGGDCAYVASVENGMTNRFLLMKCMALGALSFPTPFLMAFYTFDLFPEAPLFWRAMTVIFLLLSGGLIGVSAFYKDAAIKAMKDWFPSGEEAGRARRLPPVEPTFPSRRD